MGRALTGTALEVTFDELRKAFQQRDENGNSTFSGMIDLNAVRCEIRGFSEQVGVVPQFKLELSKSVREKALIAFDEDNKNIVRFILSAFGVL